MESKREYYTPGKGFVTFEDLTALATAGRIRESMRPALQECFTLVGATIMLEKYNAGTATRRYVGSATKLRRKINSPLALEQSAWFFSLSVIHIGEPETRIGAMGTESCHVPWQCR